MLKGRPSQKNPKQRIFLCWCLMLMIPCLAYSASNSFAPSPGKTLLLVGQDRDTIAHYIKACGITPGGVMMYTSIQNMDGLTDPIDYGSGSQDGQALLFFYPHSVIQVGLYMVGGLKGTLAGKYDANLQALAQWIQDADRPVYLRIGYEFDNPDNHYDPQEYKQAFRYVVDFLRRAGVRNAAYVWHSYCWAGKPDGQWMDWYPGDDYVDWFGVSLFATPNQLWTASSFVKLAREHHKHFMIAESTPWGMYTVRGKADFLNHVFHFIKEENVEVFCYIDSNWDVMPMYRGQHIGDNRLEAYPQLKEIWMKETSQDRYLKAFRDLFQTLGWKK